jgi:transmembrane 9 superfamily protein 2/4
MMVNKIWSAKTQLPYRYYDLPFCQPVSPDRESENLGEVLAGDRIESSDYELIMGKNEYCKVLCRKEYGRRAASLFAERIEEEYTVNWCVSRWGL